VCSSDLYLVAMPRIALQVWNASPGLAGVLGVDSPLAGGVWLDRGLADILDVRVGDRLATSQGVVLVGAIFDWPQDGRDQRLSFSILAPMAPAEPFDECWLKAWPVVDGNDILLRSTILPEANSGSAAIGRVNTSLGVSLDSAELFRARLTRFVPLLLLATGLVLGYSVSTTRRLEYASAQHIGQTKTDQLIECAIETGAWALASAAEVVLVLSAAMQLAHLTSCVELLAVVASGPLLAAGGAMTGAMGGCAVVREQRLFALFKAH
jgi:hypothetical protein